MSAQSGPDVGALLDGWVPAAAVGPLAKSIREAYADWVLAEWIATTEHLCRRTHPTRWEISTLSKACDACQIAATDATAHLADLLRGQA